MTFLNVENYHVVSIFYGMTKRNRFDEVRSENLTASLVLNFYALFTIY